MPSDKPQEQEHRIDRRQVLLYLGAVGSVAALGCGPSTSGGATDGGDSTDGGTSTTGCHEIPSETAGPYPDTKGMIGNTAFYRSNIIEDRTGTPLTLVFTVVDAANGCAPIANAHVEIWHCDAGGIYSEYSNSTNAGSTTTTYLRGVQTTDSNGQVTFKTIYPGWYLPRDTHVHIQVYNGTTLKKTTQMGFPDAINNTVYANKTLYPKGTNSTTNDSDQVYGNATGTGTDGGGHTYQIATVTGDTSAGYTATIQVAMTGYA